MGPPQTGIFSIQPVRPTGCRFRTRCPLYVTLAAPQRPICETTEPAMTESPAGVGHRAACHHTGRG
ncbi:hypothetical protein [Dactylosporangium sp. NPDC051484]|uniref:hypothetical protein n=1 Tax=Dactylosporangium sp. NPDC051484 TaxID=3154942 RepID=UPI00344E1D59